MVISITRVGIEKQTPLRVEINMFIFFKVYLSISRLFTVGRFNQLAFYCQRLFCIRFKFKIKFKNVVLN